MGEVIAVANQKGGVGKSTTVGALGDALRRKGERVLFVDFDPQGNLTHSLGGTPAKGSDRIADVMLRGTDVAMTIQHLEYGDLIASDSSLVGADITLTDSLPRREFGLRNAIAPIRDAYDYIIIDTPPTLGLLALNSLSACNSIIIPATSDIYSLQGIGQMYQTIEMVRRYYNPFVSISGILLTRFEGREILGREMSDLLTRVAQQIGSKVFDTRIRECIALRKAQRDRKSIFEYDPSGHGAEDYSALADELVGNGRKYID